MENTAILFIKGTNFKYSLNIKVQGTAFGGKGGKTMNYRKLGKTGIFVSEIGLGSEAYVNRSEEESV